LSDCPLVRSQQTHVHISPNVLYLLLLAVARSFSDGNVLPVLWMTSCFRITERMGGIGDDACVSSSWPGGRTGGEVCCLLQLVVQQILRKSEQLEFVLYRVRTGSRVTVVTG